jgi:hypothetical protein
MPIREPAAGTLPEACWRRFQFGDVATLLMTETRLTARSHQLDYGRDLPVVDGKPDFAAFAVKLKDPDRRMMGQGQEQWLTREVDASMKAGTAWQVLGNQVVMARVVPPDLKAAMGEAAYGALLAKLPAYVAKPGRAEPGPVPPASPANLDAWDGYPADRARVYDIFKAGKARPIVLAGDSHAFWANELWDDAGTARVAAEFGVTSVTSPGYGDYLPGAPLDQAYVGPQQGGEVHRPGRQGLPAADPRARPGDRRADRRLDHPGHQVPDPGAEAVRGDAGRRRRGEGAGGGVIKSLPPLWDRWGEFQDGRCGWPSADRSPHRPCGPPPPRGEELPPLQRDPHAERHEHPAGHPVQPADHPGRLSARAIGAVARIRPPAQARPMTTWTPASSRPKAAGWRRSG